MKKFEYKRLPAVNFTRGTRNIVSEEKLNELGQDGWELICFTFMYDRIAFGYFKREIK